MTRGRERRTAPILSHGQAMSGQCGFNQAASHPADPIKRHRARRERSHPKAMLSTQTSAVALDLLENNIGAERKIRHVRASVTIGGKANCDSHNQRAQFMTLQGPSLPTTMFL